MIAAAPAMALAWHARRDFAVLARREQGPLRRRLVQVLVLDPEPLMHHAEILLRDGVAVGYVRAASYGHTLGGAVGLALIDTIIFSRSAAHARHIAAQLRAGDVTTAVGIGIPRDAFLEQLGQPPDEFTQEMVRPLVEKAALVHAINDAWLAIGGLNVVAVLLVVFVRPMPRDAAGNPV